VVLPPNRFGLVGQRGGGGSGRSKAGAEADALGWGGIARVARATGLAISTVTLGRREVREGAQPDDVVKVRRKGGGRRRHEKGASEPDSSTGNAC